MPPSDNFTISIHGIIIANLMPPMFNMRVLYNNSSKVRFVFHRFGIYLSFKSLIIIYHSTIIKEDGAPGGRSVSVLLPITIGFPRLTPPLESIIKRNA